MGTGGIGGMGLGGTGGAPASCAEEGEPCGTDAGECEFGQFECEGNTAVCVGGATETPEMCDGLDNDCNGTVDDLTAPNCQPDSRQSCTTGCGSTGTQTCSAACTWGSCQPPAEVCNGQDDDCVSGADNGFACVQGATVSCMTSCLSTGTGTCTGSCALPTGDACALPTEVCNGVDDDCDGQTDEGNVCPTGCSGGMFEGRSYFYCAVEMEYPEASAFCNEIDFDLIAIESEDENAFAVQLITDDAPDVYTGGFLVDGEWRWNEGLVFWLGSNPGSCVPDVSNPVSCDLDVYDNWDSGYPDFDINGSRVLLSSGNGKWSNLGGEGIGFPYICESR
jgi:hypothetical protein